MIGSLCRSSCRCPSSSAMGPPLHMIPAAVPNARTLPAWIVLLLLVRAFRREGGVTHGFPILHEARLRCGSARHGRSYSWLAPVSPSRSSRFHLFTQRPSSSLRMDQSSSPGESSDETSELGLMMTDGIEVRDDDDSSSSSPRVDEARRLLEQASELRRQAELASEILQQKQQRQQEEEGGQSIAKRDSSADRRSGGSSNASPFALPSPRPLPVGTESEPAVSSTQHHEYRLHVDIGREPGSWMEPRWGASGRRIEFTVDVRFTGVAVGDLTDEGTLQQQQQHASSSSSLLRDGTRKGWFGTRRQQSCYSLETAPYARMRSGFDRMRCLGGVYRIDRDDASGKNRGDGTVRFCIQVDGTTDYGDVTIPPGYLYFSIPAFSSNLSLLSRKPGPVTVRQPGWNTGWRREESRIVGVFLVTPLERS